MKPLWVTFTGLDGYTSLDRVMELSARFPTEWAVLMSPSRTGMETRYPSGPLVKSITAGLFGKIAMAAHLCGGHSRDVMSDDPSLDLPVEAGRFGRIQVNHRDPDVESCGYAFKYWPVSVICQTRDEFPVDRRVQWLYDVSGGRGIHPDTWPVNRDPTRVVGYAGGITPDNVLATLDKLRGNFWIDIESGVRTDDRLDLDKCADILTAVYGRGVPVPRFA